MDKDRPLSPQEVEELRQQEQAQAWQEELKEVLSCLRSAGFQHLQARWQLLVQGYKEGLENPARSADELRVLQGCMRGARDFAAMLAMYTEAEKEQST